jgi:hypothetical protein
MTIPTQLQTIIILFIFYFFVPNDAGVSAGKQSRFCDAISEGEHGLRIICSAWDRSFVSYAETVACRVRGMVRL